MLLKSHGHLCQVLARKVNMFTYILRQRERKNLALQCVTVGRAVGRDQGLRENERNNTRRFSRETPTDNLVAM